MKKLIQGFGNIIIELAELILGVMLLVNPESVTSGIVIALGVVLICLGIISILKYFRTAPADAANQKMLAKGLIMTLIGVFCLVRYGWIVKTFTVLTALYGAVLLALGLLKLEEVVDILRMRRSRWYFAAASAAIAIIGGIVILCNPFGTAKVMWTVIGVCLIAEAACDIINIFFGNKERKEPKQEKQQAEEDEEE